MDKETNRLVARIAIRDDQLDSNCQNMNEAANNFTNLTLSEDTPVVVVNDTINNGRAKSKTKSLRKNSNIPNNVISELGESGITPLKRTSLKFPNAAFYCHVCDYHCDTIAICRKHVSVVRHMKAVDLLKQKATISVLPKPNLAQEEAITEIIMKVVKENGMAEAKRVECFALMEYLEEELKKEFPDICLLMNGSCLSGFALEASGLDLDLVISKEKSKEVGHIFEGVYKIILDNKLFINQTKTFAASYPQVCFTHVTSNVDVSIGLHNPVTIYTNELLSHYVSLDPRVKILGVAFRYWAKLCEVDKFSEGSLAPRCFPLLVIYFLQRCKDPVLPCLHKDRNNTSYTKPSEMEPRWKSENNSSVGNLWLDLLRFYAVGINFKHYLIDITSPHYLYRNTRKSIKMAIEEPLCNKNSSTGKKWKLSQSVSSSDVFYFIFTTIRNTFFYFLVPQLRFGSLFSSIKDAEYLSKEPDNDTSSQEKDNTSVNDTVEGETIEEANEPEIKTDRSCSSYYDIVSWPSYNVEDQTDVVKIDDLTSSFKSVEFRLALKLTRTIEKRHLAFRFHTDCFTRGESVPLKCPVCHMGGHTKKNCKEFELPPLCRLPFSYSRAYDETLDITLKGLKEYHEPSEKEVNYRAAVLEKLQSFIRESYPEAVLELFGSSTNGFGFSESDLDICLTFKDSPTDKDIDHIQIIKNLAQKLKTGISRDLEVREIMAITTAKVPIVKFLLPKSFLEVDISLYNTLALRNTNLLNTYAMIDDRVQIIGYAFKFIAKLCQIGDASRGSLSSYAYILLVIHYLQNCSPPVLPVLHELHKGKTKPQHIVDGWDTWFCDDIKIIPKVWKGYKKNKMSVPQLWIGLLRYYTETFDWDLNVVSIRQSEPLSRLEKMWNTMCISIEDPFDLNHNLGGGLSRRMSTFIMKCFIRAREAFGASAVRCTRRGQLIDCTFNTTVLMDGFPPNDRGCRCCGKIGHIVKDCPKKKQIEDRKREKKRVENRQQRKKPLPALVDRSNAESVTPQKQSSEIQKDSPLIPQTTANVCLNQEKPITSQMFYPTGTVAASESTAPIDIPATTGSTSYSVSDFIRLVGSAGELPTIQSLKPLTGSITSVKSTPHTGIVPPPGFASPPGGPRSDYKVAPHQVTPIATQHNVYSPKTVTEPLTSNRMEYSDGMNGQMFAMNRSLPVEMFPSQTAINSNHVQPPMPSAANRLESVPYSPLDLNRQAMPASMLNKTLPVGFPGGNMSLGYANCSPDDMNRLAQSAALSRQIPTDAFGRCAQQTDALHRQAQQMDPWNMRQFSNEMPRPYPLPGRAPVSVPQFGGSSSLPHVNNSLPQAQFARTAPDIFTNRMDHPAMQHMMMYGASNNSPVYNAADIIPPGFASQSPYQLSMINAQNFPQENKGQPDDLNRSYHQ